MSICSWLKWKENCKANQSVLPCHVDSVPTQSKDGNLCPATAGGIGQETKTGNTRQDNSHVIEILHSLQRQTIVEAMKEMLADSKKEKLLSQAYENSKAFALQQVQAKCAHTHKMIGSSFLQRHSILVKIKRVVV